MDFEQSKLALEKKITNYQKKGLSLFASSSFQTQSMPLLHLISQVDCSIPVYFLNTGYHFLETLNFRDKVAKLLNLNVKELRSPVSRSLQRDFEGNLLYISDPDRCCYLNKVMPLDPIMEKYDVWISGVRRDQTQVRENFREEQEAPRGVLRFHPLLEWTEKEVEEYIQHYQLPRHPLEGECQSVGCEPCTVRKKEKTPSQGYRSNRWYGQHKTECGLHTELGEK